MRADLEEPREEPATWVVSRGAIAALAGLTLLAAVGLSLGLSQALVYAMAYGALTLGLMAAVWDWRWTQRTWQREPLRLERSQPTALALGVKATVQLRLINASPYGRRVQVFDDLDASFAFDGLPQSVLLPAGRATDLEYLVTARRRGQFSWGRVQLRMGSHAGIWERVFFLGQTEAIRVYPNFAALARYAWLAGDRRLAQIGIKSYAQRGQGTDFKQLAEYQMGDAIRDIDWKATLRHRKPIVRQYQDERDQQVLFLLDAGRRMRADETAGGVGESHFDQALNAMMLLSFVALKAGDKVGAITFGQAIEDRRHLAPRGGAATLNTLMAGLYDIEPGLDHSDYQQLAQDVMRRQARRALVIMLTNFRHEDATELQPALQLLRRRHLVLVVSLKERILRELAERPLEGAQQAALVASAHYFAQSRADAFRRSMGHDAHAIDVEPSELAPALVNQYHAIKQAGLL